ncbi:hypothetical protein [Rhizobium bangladeshense]|uniref:hypothetical protein n=1 Tax=Rhizobium bangladeshense TaxID=1138189 RepID=UPI001C82F82B|nr:hypothetical protein [Rhizobium bangladeshense]
MSSPLYGMSEVCVGDLITDVGTSDDIFITNKTWMDTNPVVETTFVSNGHVAFSSVQTVLEPFGCSSIERHGWKQKDRDVGLHWPLRHNLAPVVRQSPHPIFISVLHSKIEAVDLPHLANPISIPGLTQ